MPLATGSAPQQLPRKLRCDVILFVAVATEEKQLKAVAKELGLAFEKCQGGHFDYFDLGQVGTFRVLAVRTEMGPFSHDGSAARALLAKAETGATALVSVGMGFGVDRTTQKPGDILVSQSLLTYDKRRVHSGFWSSKVDYSEITPFQAKETLLKTLRRLAQDQRWRTVVKFGPMLTGGARIHCARFRDHLVNALSRDNERVIGGEMEGVGLLSASNPEAPSWIVVKGICDYADKRRDAEVIKWRALACENAARFVLTALRDFDPESES
jgi:adenosylhomocysteine nucleosidase